MRLPRATRQFFLYGPFSDGRCGGPCASCSYTLFFARFLHARVQGCSSRTRGKTAGNRLSFVEASRGKDLAEQGLVRERPNRLAPKALAAEKASKADQREGCGPQRSRHSTGPASSEEANELGTGRPRDSSGHQLQVQRQEAGTSESAATKGRSVP